MISVLILTRNEEVNLPRALASVNWSKDLVVVDSGSTDQTVAIAEKAGARVLTRPFDNFANQRNFGLTEAGLKYEWVLHLDADEEVPAELRQELQELARSGTKAAYRVPSKLMFQGKWLRYSGMYPTYQVRFGKRDHLRFHEVGHGQRELIKAEELGTVRNALVHHNFSKGLSDWFERHNRYSSAEAELAVRAEAVDLRGLFAVDPVKRRRTAKGLASKLPFRPLLRFVYMFVLRGGFLDGCAGYTYCRLMAQYEYMIVLKVRERRHRA